MAYLTEAELESKGFKHLGRGVKISSMASIYNHDQISIGDYSRIDDFCVISGKVFIGKRCHITPHCLVAGGLPGIIIDDYATLAYGVKVFAQSDDYSGETLTNSLIPKKYKKEIFKSVSIGRHSIAGAGSTILPGADIAEGVALGAMSLVIRPTTDWKIYAGVPARIIKDRARGLLNLIKQFEEEHNDTL